MVAAAAAQSEPGDRATEQAPPNVVLLISDDQGWGDIGYHNEKVWSPRLDALAARGARFTQAYSMPQCTPTRVALMTGRYPSRFGKAARQASNAPAFPLGTPTLASLFAAADYHTALAGKWHLGSSFEHGPLRFGFQSSYGSLAGAVGMYDHRYRDGKFGITWHRDDKLLDREENGVHATDLVAAEACRIIEDRDQRPFFLYVPFHSVHTPLDERGRFVDRPTQLDPERPGRWLDEDEIEWFHDPEGRIQSEPDPEKRLFLASVHHLDAAVGRIVDAIDRAGLREDTLIVFTSDNGPQVSWGGNAYPDDLKLTDFNQPLPMRGKKVDVWEGGIHVPAFAVWPGRIEARNVDTPVHVVDWFPTLAAILDPDSTPEIAFDGADLGPLLLQGGKLPERALYWNWGANTNRWTLRYGDWKIVHYGRPAPDEPDDWQLFDLENDPREQTDVAAQHPKILADLHARYLAQRARDR